MTTVKKLGKKTKKKKIIRRQATVSSQAAKLSGLALPTSKKEANHNLTDFTILVYGREKIGKTMFFASFPDALFFTTEPGTKGLEIFEFNHEDGGCRNWTIIKRGVDLLEANPRQFKNVVFDTIDRAYDMCMDWVCQKRGIEYPGQDEMGREDFGKSWRAVKQEFISVIHRILQLGMGLCFTSHSTEAEIKSKSGDKYTRIYPSMSGQGRKVIEALVDLFFYAEYVRASDGSTQRVLITQGDETIWAGHRNCGHPIPQFLPLTETDGYATLNSAFQGEDVGLDPATFMPGRQTSETAKKLMQRQKGKTALEKRTKKKKKIRR